MDLTPPFRIGHCEVEAQIGQGGMGTVFRGRHEALGYPVALKILSDELVAEPGYVKRFLKEGRTAARLQHPNVVKVIDAGEEDGRYFIVMELIDGEALVDRLEREGTIPTAEARQLLRQAAAGLAKAHEAGLVHRDIKPDNLLVTREGTLKVADFGLAKSLAPETRLTQAGLVMGTPAFMSPEQCEGQDLTPATDVYSLGATFFRVVTGQLPFLSASPGQLLLMHIEAPVPYASEVNPDVPADFSDLLCKMMAKSRKRRFADAGELLRFLDSGEAAEFRGGVGEDRASRVAPSVPLAQRPALWLAAGAGAGFAVLLALWAFAVLARGNRESVASGPAPATAASSSTEPAVPSAVAADPAAVEPSRAVPDPEPATTDSQSKTAASPDSAAVAQPTTDAPPDAATATSPPPGPTGAEDLPDDPGACVLAGVALLERGDLAGAEAAFQRAHALRPDEQCSRQIAAIAAHRARIADAERALARERFDDAEAAFAAAQRGLFVEATEARLGRVRRFRACLTAGDAHLAAGRPAEAERAFAEARDLFDTPLVRVRLDAARSAADDARGGASFLTRADTLAHCFMVSWFH